MPHHISVIGSLPITSAYRYCALAQPFSELAAPLSNTSPLIHQMNRLSVVGVDDREGAFAAGWLVAPLPRRRINAGTHYLTARRCGLRVLKRHRNALNNAARRSACFR
jgi:hypothetical protein